MAAYHHAMPCIISSFEVYHYHGMPCIISSFEVSHYHGMPCIISSFEVSRYHGMPCIISSFEVSRYHGAAQVFCILAMCLAGILFPIILYTSYYIYIIYIIHYTLYIAGVLHPRDVPRGHPLRLHRRRDAGEETLPLLISP